MNFPSPIGSWLNFVKFPKKSPFFTWKVLNINLELDAKLTGNFSSDF